MIEYLRDILLGYIIGLISGLLPSFHINNTALFLYYLKISYKIDIYHVLLFSSSSFVIGALLSVMFYDVPSNEDNLYIPYILRYVKKKGVKSYFLLSLLSMALALIFLIIFISLFNNLIIKIYEISISYLNIVLTVVIILFVLKYRDVRYILIMLIASVLGFLVISKLNINQNYTLLPLFVGFYGIPYLLLSIKENQKEVSISKKYPQDFLKVKDLIRYSLLGVIVSFIAIVLPAVPPILLLSFLPLNRKYAKGHIISMASLSISDSILSIVSQKIINNSRSGVGVILGNIKEISFLDIYALIFVTSFYLLISYLLLQKLFFNRKTIKFIEHKAIKILVLVFILVLTYFTTSFIGLVILFLSSIIGYLTLKMKLTPIVLLFSIIIPLWYSLII